MTVGKNIHTKMEENVLNPILVVGISALIVSNGGCTEAARVS